MAKTNPDTVIACPPLITEKVRQFDEHLDTYTSGDYSEAQLRVDFLNPMIKALGWDVDNEKEYAEAYREVVYEDAIKVGGTTKAPDYGFYIGGRAAGGGRKFFLEAKKPSVAIRVDPKPAFQLRRYAYSAQLPLSILTNFKDFIVYDTRFKPSAKDNARVAAVLTIKYTEYAERWHEIASVFSRSAILRGAFDKFARGKRKKGMEPLGDSFLEDIEGWRKLLASEIAKSNPDITVDDLNFAVQRTIDRILFLRICEDRGIEQAHNLMALLNGEKVYARLGQIFRGADDRYNSGIFHFPAAGKKPDPDRAEPPDDLTLDLVINDQPLKQIIRGLYDTGQLFTSYAFAVIPPEILGHVYEQFLGKVIRLTAGRRVKIEEKPEVRKAGGVYYTPAYIVDYIVKNTVGKLLEGKSPKQAQKLRILDPASGSGSFLIGAYQFLLDWHLRWYLDNDPEKHRKGKNQALMRIHSPSLDGEPDAPKTKSNGRYDYRLTTAKRKDILINSIYGVDIDPQAVEVTKLSLLLKVLEGESQESINAQMKFLHQRALPDLGRNIKCGNSLIGDDFDDGELSEEERQKINKFNWETEFPKIFKSGGFDAVIGNPPYIQLSMAEYYNDAVSDYYKREYSSSMGRLNTFGLFTERCIATLVRPGAYIAFIVPNTILTQEGYRDIRLMLLKMQIVNLTAFEYPVFDGAVVETIVFAVRKAKPDRSSIEVVLFDNREMSFRKRSIHQRVFRNTHNNAFLLFADEQDLLLQAKLDDSGSHLGGLANLNQAIALAHDRSASIFRSKRAKNYKPVLDGRHINRYRLEWGGEYLAYDVGKIHSCKRTDIFEKAEKLFFRRVGDRLIATYDDEQYYALNTLVVITPKIQFDGSLRYLLGLINSELLNFYYVKFLKSTKKVFSEVQARQLAQLPIRTIDFSRKSDKTAHDRMVKLVDRMLDLHKRLAAAKSPHDKERIPRDIEATDRQIDKLVYDLYGLTDEEIAIVESG
ncbi:MAG: N-6 DNA methylase [Planctomycetes bacterium]|nr:N-6 DNA methylase [Planctomycetota bacterium]